MYVIENLTPYSPIAWLRPKLYTHATTSTTQILSCDRSKLRQAATPAKSHHSWLKSPVELIHFIYTRVDHCRAGVMHGATLQELFKPRPLRDHHTVFDCILRKPGKTTLSSKSIPSRCVAWLQIDVDSISSFTQKLNCHRKNWSPHHGCNQYLYNDKHIVRANQHTHPKHPALWLLSEVLRRVQLCRMSRHRTYSSTSLETVPGCDGNQLTTSSVMP